MKRYFGILLSVVVLTLTVTQCYNLVSIPKQTVGQPPLTQTQQMIATSSRSFGVNVFRKIVSEQPDSNIFISPLSLSLVLDMAANGAASDTRSAMLKTLDLPDSNMQDLNTSYQGLMNRLMNADPKVKMELANAIWYRNTFNVKQSFIQACRKYYDARVQALDFNKDQSADIINQWVSDKTHGKITNLVNPPIPPDMMMYLMNAIYFKGSWTLKFDSTATRRADFTLSDGSTVKPEMMHMADSLPLYQSDHVQMLDLAYGDSLFSMDIILPRPGTSINNFVAGLSKDKLDHWIDQLRDVKVGVSLPKFKIDYEIRLKKVLSDLGMETAFSSGADFSNINPDMPLQISEVKQKSYIKVDESGTEAAAATYIAITTSATPRPKVFLFNADRPFVYLIRERSTGTILFIGKMGNPVK